MQTNQYPHVFYPAVTHHANMSPALTDPGPGTGHLETTPTAPSMPQLFQQSKHKLAPSCLPASPAPSCGKHSKALPHLPPSFCVQAHLVLPHVALHDIKCPLPLGIRSHKLFCQDIVSGSVILPDLKNAILGACQDTLQPCEIGEMGILMYHPHS